MMRIHRGGCHCGAIGLELRTSRDPAEQIVGACQCGFCRKHNARAFSDPRAEAGLHVHEPRQLQLYRFGWGTADAVICRRCGIYVAMVLRDEGDAWSTINIDALDDRALFTREAEPRDYSIEDAKGRIDRRKARWIPTTLSGWPSEG